VRPSPWDSPLVVKRIGMSFPGYTGTDPFLALRLAGAQPPLRSVQERGPSPELSADAVDDRRRRELVGVAFALGHILAADAVGAVRTARLARLGRIGVDLDALDPQQMDAKLVVVHRQEVVAAD